MQRARTLDKTVWPSGLRRWLQAPVRKGVGSNPTAVTFGTFVAMPSRNRKIFFYFCSAAIPDLLLALEFQERPPGRMEITDANAYTRASVLPQTPMHNSATGN